MAKRRRRPDSSSKMRATLPQKRGFESHPWLLALVLVAVTCIVYIPAIRGEFVWDDSELITENRMISDANGLQRIWFTTEALDYFPITLSTFWLEWRLFGGNP